MMRSTSERTLERVKDLPGASRISGRILSFFSGVALENDAVDDRVLAHLDDDVAGSAPVICASANSSTSYRARMALSSVSRHRSGRAAVE
jgi:hypothetical protein